MQLIIQPKIPCSIPTKDGLPNLAEIIIDGEAFQGVEKCFEITFYSKDDIALRLLARFDDENCNNNMVILNSKINEKCGKEESYTNPFNIGQKFRLEIINYHNFFMIKVGKCYCFEFCHRISPLLITHLEINGNINVEKIQLGNFEPTKCDLGEKNTSILPKNTSILPMLAPLNPKIFVIRNPEIPFTQQLKNGLPPNYQIIIDGETNMNACCKCANEKSFSIILFAEKNIALQLYANFDDSSNNIVLNSIINDKLEDEQIMPNPLKIGEKFRIQISNYLNMYTIAFDDLIYSKNRFECARPLPERVARVVASFRCFG